MANEGRIPHGNNAQTQSLSVNQMMAMGTTNMTVNSDILSIATALEPSDTGNMVQTGTHANEGKKKKPGRSPSQIWVLLTDEPNPQRKNAAACKHCKQQVLYYKKSEQAIRHLKKCSVFQSNQHQYAFIAQFQDILPLYNQKINAKGSSRKRKHTIPPQNRGTQAKKHEQRMHMTSSQMIPSAQDHLQIGQSHFGDSNLSSFQGQQLYSGQQVSGQTGAVSTPLHLGTQVFSDSFIDASNVLKDEREGSHSNKYSNSNHSIVNIYLDKEGDANSTSATGNWTGRKSQRGITQLLKRQQEEVEEALAMHIFVSGLPFDAIEDPHLDRALTIIRADVKLPDKNKLLDVILQRCFDKISTKVWRHMSSNSSFVCVKRDDWSGRNIYKSSQKRSAPLHENSTRFSGSQDALFNEEISSDQRILIEAETEEEEIYTTYIAVRDDLNLFLESEPTVLDYDSNAEANQVVDALKQTFGADATKTDRNPNRSKDGNACKYNKPQSVLDMQYNSILIAQDIKRVMGAIGSNVAGVVTASTKHHARAWELLKAEHPTKFFYGCACHALHLILLDIFYPEKAIDHDPQHLLPVISSEYPFIDLMNFIYGCAELTTFLTNQRYLYKSYSMDLYTFRRLQSVSTTTQLIVERVSLKTLPSSSICGSVAWTISPLGIEVEALTTCFSTLQELKGMLQAFVNAPEFLLLAPNEQLCQRERLKSFCLQSDWAKILDQILGILHPIQLMLAKFQDSQTPISEVYMDLRRLQSEVDVFGLAPKEAAYMIKIVNARVKYTLSDVHALAYLLDPRYIGRSISRDYREKIEDIIFTYPECDSQVAACEHRKRIISSEYTEYVVYAKSQRANRTFKWEMLEKGDRTPLQFWMAEGDDWPHLKPLALALFSLKASSMGTDSDLKMQTLSKLFQNNRQHYSALNARRLAFIVINESLLLGSSSLYHPNAVCEHTERESSTIASNTSATLSELIPLQGHSAGQSSDFTSTSGSGICATSSSDPALLPEGMMMWMI
uniref:Transposase putative n=1 Tax=Albugo laibachii Nc14 TaxID=890382 RepID=F0WDM0_9STRA|nr:transposase putative [Albugo laibachii Nc14]|eukprot:CCA19295.1 transposase putative [Albugo laibachii Nc14]